LIPARSIWNISGHLFVAYLSDHRIISFFYQYYQYYGRILVPACPWLNALRANHLRVFVANAYFYGFNGFVWCAFVHARFHHALGLIAIYNDAVGA